MKRYNDPNVFYDIYYVGGNSYTATTGSTTWSDTVKQEHKIGAREAIGMVKLMYRCTDHTDIEGVIDILTETDYSDDDRSFLNKVRKNTQRQWMQLPNGKVIRELMEEKERLMIVDLSHPDDNKRGVNDPQELALNYRQDLLKANLFIVVDSYKEIVHIVKSYFNTPIAKETPHLYNDE